MYQEDKAVQNEWVVYLDYSLKYEDGSIVTNSREDGQIAFIQGHGHVFPMIEGAIEGMHVGDELELTLPPQATYGEYNEEAVEVLPLQAFPDEVEIEEGLEIGLYDEEADAEIDAVVIEVRDEEIVVDMNHPLAGETLIMWLRIADLRPATEEELEHDHVHTDDHNHSSHE